MDQRVARNLLPARPLIRAILCCAILSGAISASAANSENPVRIPARKIDQSVLAALSRQGLTQPTVISHLDLTRAFQTATQWTLVIVRNDAQPSADSPPQEDRGPIFVCLVNAAAPDCAQHFYRPIPGESPASPYHLFATRVVYAGRDESEPLLLVQVCTAQMFDGNCGVATVLYRYDRPSNRFACVFLDVTGRNNNEATRFVEAGPLQGEVIVDYPTEHAPFTYWIEVYRAQQSRQYQRILRYRGHTVYNDGNPLAVADSEMPEILRRLGFWKPGDALPRPAHLPQGCTRLFMRRSEEWCK